MTRILEKLSQSVPLRPGETLLDAVIAGRNIRRTPWSMLLAAAGAGMALGIRAALSPLAGIGFTALAGSVGAVVGLSVGSILEQRQNRGETSSPTPNSSLGPMVLALTADRLLVFARSSVGMAGSVPLEEISLGRIAEVSTSDRVHWGITVGATLAIRCHNESESRSFVFQGGLNKPVARFLERLRFALHAAQGASAR